MADQTDKQLLARIRAGDQGAFEDLLRSKDRLLYGVAYRLLGNRQDAEDAVYAAYEELIQKLDCIRNGDALSAWLITTVKRKAFDMLRKNNRSIAVEITDELAGASSPDYAEISHVGECLKKLPADQFDALMLYNSGLKLREIGGLLDMPTTSVWALIDKAKRTFIKIYEG